MGMTTNPLRTGLLAVAFAVGTLAAVSVPSFFSVDAPGEQAVGAPSLALPLAVGALALSLLSACVQNRPGPRRSSWGIIGGSPWRLAGPTASGSPRGRQGDRFAAACGRL